MASGVSKTLPTMRGLVISISGLFAITVVERFIQDKQIENGGIWK